MQELSRELAQVLTRKGHIHVSHNVKGVVKKFKRMHIHKTFYAFERRTNSGQLL